MKQILKIVRSKCHACNLTRAAFLILGVYAIVYEIWWRTP
jgi:hypothetical protein